MTSADRDAWYRMRCQLWPGSDSDHAEELGRFFREGAMPGLAAALVAVSGDRLIGFAELSIRPCAEGCVTDRVGYLEGWWVEADARRLGVGASLVRAALDWARAEGCRELASDTEPENEASRLAHLACGFEDVGLVRCFRRRL